MILRRGPRELSTCVRLRLRHTEDEGLTAERHALLIDETGRWLRRTVPGSLNNHAVPGSSHCLCCLVNEGIRLWLGVICRWSQRVAAGKVECPLLRFTRLCRG
jgi:hypothetical protein